MDQHTHKVLDWLHHLWPYVSALVLTMVAVVKLYFHERKMTRERITNLERIAEHTASREELYKCRDQLLDDDEHHMKTIYGEIKEVRREIRQYTDENAEQHKDIMKTILSLHADDKK